LGLDRVKVWLALGLGVDLGGS